MAVTETLKKLSASLLLENGTTTTGAVKTKSQNMGSLNASAWDATKAYTIAQAMEALLDAPLYELDAQKTYKVDEEE